MRYPDLYYICEKASKDKQTAFLVSRGSEFTLLTLAAGLGEIPTSTLHHAASITAFALFVVALIVRLSNIGDRAEKRWYDARAAAESIKSTSWQFAVKCEPYGLSDSDSKKILAKLLRDILSRVPKLEVDRNLGTNVVASDEMIATRALNTADRIAKYKLERVQDQIDWYKRQAILKRRLARNWKLLLIGLESTAVVLGFVRIFGGFEVNWMGILATGAAGAAAWQQTRNFTFLSESYSVTTLELAFVLDTLSDVIEEEKWSDVAHDAESAFSREHGLWLVRRKLTSD